MHHLVTGGSGFIGRALCAELVARGQRVTVLTRSPRGAMAVLPRGVRTVEHLEVLRNDVPQVIVNLAGENLAAGRWNAPRKKLLVESRLRVTRAVVDFARSLRNRPRVLISGSAIGWYGARGDEELTEEAVPGTGFPAQLCQAWEAEAQKAEALGLRVCRLRTGIVLGAGGGALARMLPAFRLGLGGVLGSGNQWMSWVHRADLVELILWLSAQDSAHGSFNGTAPQPVTNREFTETLAAVLGRQARWPIPAGLLRLLVGEMAEILVTGQKVLPARALQMGFRFRHPELRPALCDALGL